jgi:hypothetical protein
MSDLVELLRDATGKVLINEDATTETIELLPPLSVEELRTLEFAIPCRVSDEMQSQPG